jgi:arylsulfatase A-like enzyme
MATGEIASSSCCTVRCKIQARAIVGLVLLALAGCADRAADAPNIVVVVADDLDLRSARALPFYQRLAARSLEFREHVTRTPVCAPSRASLLTGLGHERHGVGFAGKGQSLATLEQHEARTLGPLLEAAGYRTMMAGKYVNRTGCTHRAAGWERWLVVCRALYDELAYKVNDDGRDWRPRVYQTDFLRERVLDFLREDDARPAFVYLAPPAPHGPMKPAPRHADAELPPLLATPTFAGNRSTTEAERRRRLRSTLAVGELVEAVISGLEALDRPWLLVFTADNGMQDGAHGWRFKDVVYEESIRVPLVILGSGVQPGTRDEQTIHEDVAATVLARARALPPDLDGDDLLAGEARHRRIVLRAGTSEAVRTKRWKRIRWDDGRIEDFDLRRDPYEASPRVRAPSSAPAGSDTPGAGR